MITIEQLEEMFANMREHTDWDVDGELLWGYFFTDADPDKLEKAAEALDQMGYDVVEIFQSEGERGASAPCAMESRRPQSRTDFSKNRDPPTHPTPLIHHPPAAPKPAPTPTQPLDHHPLPRIESPVFGRGSIGIGIHVPA